MKIVILFGLLALATASPSNLFDPPLSSIRYEAGFPVGVVYSPASDSQGDPDGDDIPGTAGVDYPDISVLPDNDTFNCSAQNYPGLYADPTYGCQVFHICNLERVKYSFLCPLGSILNQQYFVCDWWYNVQCQDAPNYYYLNEGFYNTSIPATTTSPQTYQLFPYNAAQNAAVQEDVPEGEFGNIVPIHFPHHFRPIPVYYPRPFGHHGFHHEAPTAPVAPIAPAAQVTPSAPVAQTAPATPVAKPVAPVNGVRQPTVRRARLFGRRTFHNN